MTLDPVTLDPVTLDPVTLDPVPLDPADRAAIAERLLAARRVHAAVVEGKPSIAWTRVPRRPVPGAAER